MRLFLHARPALSRVDVLVLLVVVSLLAGISIPLIVRQRGNADRAHCSYNLERLGKAVSDFDDRNHYLPPARIAEDYATWAVLVAPYLQKDHPLEKWDTSKPYAAQDAEIRQALLKEMYCPARIRPTSQSTQGDGDPNLPGAIGDYACVSGNGRAKSPWTGPDANGPMILGVILKEEKGRIVKWQGRIRLNQTSLPRGLSTTLLLGEKHVPLDKLGRADQGDGCVYNGRNPASSARIGGPGFGIASSPSAPFNSNFGGPHPGVCLFLLADLSLRPMTLDVNEKILGELTARDVE